MFRQPSHKWILALVLTALAAPFARAAEVDPYLPNDTQFVVNVNVKQIIDSPLVKKYALDVIKTALQSNEIQQVLSPLGFDPLKDITAVTLAGPGGGPEENKGLLIVHGKFDLEKFRAKAEEVAKENSDNLKIEKEGDNTIYQTNVPSGDQKKPVYIGLVDADTLVVAGDKSYVAGAFDRKAGKSKVELSKELDALLAESNPNQSVSFVALAGALGKGPLGGGDEAKKLIEKINTVTGGLTVTEEVKLHVLINAKDEEGAKELVKELDKNLDEARQTVAFFATGNAKIAPVAEALKSVEIASKGNQVTIHGEITRDQIEKTLQKDKGE